MIYSARSKPRLLLDRLLPLRIHQPAAWESIASAALDLESDREALELAARIRSRIESRLPGRIRELRISTTENAVVLSGECSTFYSKQLAQHAAMGVLEYEQLINNIAVCVTK